jgi:hypothetical protein
MGEVAGVRPYRFIESVNLTSRAVSAVLLLAGLVLCLGSALGLTKALCLTEGCKLYQGYSFLGLSLHVWGAGAFGTGLILLLCPLGRLSAYRRFLQICLWAEIVLLAWQVIYLPCSECLLVGLIWGLLALVEMRDRISFKVWSVVFLVALVLMSKDLLHPWPVYGGTGAVMKVYFSPSCPGCKSEINKLLAGGEVDLGRVAFFPVALKSGDYERVEAFQNVLKHTLNIPQAFQAFWSETVHAPVGWREWLTVRLGLLRNRMVLARMGINKIPLVVSGSAGMVTGAQAGNAGECGFEEGKDCADSMGPAAQPDSTKQIGRDGFRIKGQVSQGRQPAPVVVAQVQSDQVEQAEPDTQDIWSFCQQEPTESAPQPQVNEGEDQGGYEGLVEQDKDSQPEE